MSLEKPDPLIPVLYHDPVVDSCLTVHLLSLEAGIPINFRVVWLWKGQNRDQEFVEKVNPRHEVPAMKHQLDGEDFCLTESHAIMQYLCELHGSKTYKEYFGRNIAERSLITQFISWHHMALRKPIMKDHLLPSFIRPFYMGTTVLKRPSENLLSKSRSGLMEPLMHLDNALKGKDFLVGGRLTAADLFIAPTIGQILIDPEYDSILANFPSAVNWLRRLSQRDSWKVAHYVVTDVLEEIRKHYASQSSVPGNFDWTDVWEKKFESQIIREENLADSESSMDTSFFGT